MLCRSPQTDNKAIKKYLTTPAKSGKKQQVVNIYFKKLFENKQRYYGLPLWLSGRVHLQCRRHGFSPWVGKIPWKRARQPTPVFLPGESPWTEEPSGYSPLSRKESDMNVATEQVSEKDSIFKTSVISLILSIIMCQ